MNIIEQMKRVIEDHERRITRLEMKLNKEKVLNNPHMQKILERALKEVELQRGRKK